MESSRGVLNLRQFESADGKGMAGCLFFLALLGIAFFVGIVAGPTYYSYYGFETDVKAAVSRAGANFLDNEAVAKDILDIAKRNEIRLTRENVKLERFAGQLFVTVQYSVPVDFIILEQTLNFEVKASTYVGRL
jgi:hypothetical protein